MKINLKIATLLAMIILILTACTPVASAAEIPTVAPSSTPREAQVQNVEIQMVKTDPLQVNVIVRGNLTEACAKLADPQLSYTNQTFMITLLTLSPSDRGCAQVITPFEQTIPLNVAGLPLGEYLVKANGVSAVFTLPSESAPTVEPSPSGRQDQFKTFTSAFYGYKVSYPADWKILINTSVPSKPGSNPEYVTLTANDSSNLPRIEIEVLTGEPPMLGYENCLISNDFVFRGLPACKISLPAGQNPATELWIFQNGPAHFYLAMQYEGAEPVQTFSDFLSSFEFTQ